MIVLAAHHKTGSTMLSRMFSELAAVNGLKFLHGTQRELTEDVDIFLEGHAHVNTHKLPKYFKGLHVIRHPYEVVVSGFKYHKRTKEEWCKVPRGSLDGKSYQDYINSLCDDEGITFEAIHTAYDSIIDMYHWDYSDKRFLTVHLEDFSADWDTIMIKILTFLDMENRELLLEKSKKFDKGSSLANKFFSRHFTNQSTDAYTYQKYLKPHHYRLFDIIFPTDLMSRLGYDHIVANLPTLAEVRSAISRFYTLILGRSVNENGLKYWTERIMQYRETPADVAIALFASREYMDLHQDNSTFIDTATLALFDRKANRAEQERLHQKMDVDGIKRENIIIDMTKTEAFQNLMHRYGF